MTNIIGKTLVFIVAAAAAVATAGCGDTERTAYSRFEKIPGEGWRPDDVVAFEPWPLDSLEAAGNTYTMQLVLRYSSRCRLERLPAAVTVEDADRTLRDDTLVIGPGGDGAVSVREKYGVREVTAVLDPNVSLTDGYAVSVSPLLDPARTAGLLSVGIRLLRN